MMPREKRAFCSGRARDSKEQEGMQKIICESLWPHERVDIVCQAGDG